VEGFEWILQLFRSRCIAPGLMVPLHDIMNHDVHERANVKFVTPPDMLHTGRHRYEATARRDISRGELLHDTYMVRWSNTASLRGFDFVHEEGVDPGATFAPMTAADLASAIRAASVSGAGMKKGRRGKLTALLDVERRASHEFRQDCAHVMNATRLEDLLDDFGILLLEVAVDSSPTVAARKAASRGFRPKPSFTRTGGLGAPKRAFMRAILGEWARAMVRKIRRWFQESVPTWSTPLHRVDGVRRLAAEYIMVAENTLALLGAAS